MVFEVLGHNLLKFIIRSNYQGIPPLQRQADNEAGIARNSIPAEKVFGQINSPEIKP
jgi:hypothetical protein